MTPPRGRLWRGQLYWPEFELYFVRFGLRLAHSQQSISLAHERKEIPGCPGPGTGPLVRFERDGMGVRMGGAIIRRLGVRRTLAKNPTTLVKIRPQSHWLREFEMWLRLWQRCPGFL